MSQPAATASTSLPASETEATARASAGGGQEANRRILKALVIGPRLKEEPTTGKTKEIPQDEFLQVVQSDKLVEPPFDPLVLAMLPEHSTEMGPSVEAMEINCDGYGFRLEPRVRMDAPDLQAALKTAVEAERVDVLNFFNNCGLNLEDSFTMLRRKRRRDLETTGNAYWEVIRHPVSGRIDALNHIPSHQMRLGRQDEEFTTYSRKRTELQAGGEVTIREERVSKRFRPFIQARSSSVRGITGTVGGRVRWFKEYGDPRVMNNETGECFAAGSEKANAIPEEKRASEIIHWRLYSPRSPYGLPRYIGCLISIFGDRAAEEINFVTLRNNNIPSMAVIVSNGQLTPGSIGRIQEFVEAQIQGSENYSRFLLLEAEGQFEGESTGGMKIEIRPLTDQQMRDQMFQEYGKNNADKVRRAWRLPPIFLGRSDDYSKGTAETSRRLADEQIFKPERDEFDNVMNRILLNEMGVRYHRFTSNGPNVTDDQDMIQVLMAGERTGGLTPQLARTIMSDVMGRDLPPIDPAKLDPDIPFSIQMAQAVKNQAAAQTGGTPEVGSQVTALKRAGLSVMTAEDILKALITGRDELAEELEAILGIGAPEE